MKEQNKFTRLTYFVTNYANSLGSEEFKLGAFLLGLLNFENTRFLFLLVNENSYEVEGFDKTGKRLYFFQELTVARKEIVQKLNELSSLEIFIVTPISKQEPNKMFKIV